MSSVPQLVSAVPAAAPKNARVPTMHQLAQLFPEVPKLSVFTDMTLRGFVEPGSGVPERIAGFIQEYAFIVKMVAFLKSRWFMMTLTGPTGCGKTERVLDFFSRLNIPVLHDCATQFTKIWDLVGDMELVNGATTFRPKKLYKAMKYGYPYLLDEGYRLSPAVTSKLHMIRDRGELSIDETGETLKAAPGFKFFMTSNQGGFGDFTGAYSGDSVQDVAFLNGSVILKCGYPAADIEIDIVDKTLRQYSSAFVADPAVSRDVAEKMVKVANAIRAVYVGNDNAIGTQDRVEIPFSTRTLVMWAEYFVAFRDLDSGVPPVYESLDFCALDRACDATRITIDGFIQTYFSQARASKPANKP